MVEDRAEARTVRKLAAKMLVAWVVILAGKVGQNGQILNLF